MDEGDESAKVCMHFGGEALTTNATFTIQNGSALSKFHTHIHTHTSQMALAQLFHSLVENLCVCVCMNPRSG